MPLSRDRAVVNEGATASLVFALFQEVLVNGRMETRRLTLSELSTLTITYYLRSDGTIINSRNDLDALNANNVTVHRNGQVVWELQTADTALSDDTIDPDALEEHAVKFTWTTTDGRTDSAVYPIFIRQRQK